MLPPDHIPVTGCGDEYVPPLGRLLHSRDLEAVHHCLEGPYGVDLGDYDPGSHAP
ncbi:hypothetical protein D1872_349500 [compost metagenome]